MKYLVLLGLLLASLSATPAQTTYNSLSVSGQPGEPRATFVFGHAVNGNPGATQLVVQCDFGRAWLITNVDVYGYQETSNTFAISCSSPSAAGPFTVNSTPLSVTLTMYDMSGNNKGNLNLTVNSAEFTMSTGRWHPSTGSASITF